MLVNEVDFDILCDPRTLVLETGEVLHPDLRTEKEVSEKDALVKALTTIDKLTDVIGQLQEKNKQNILKCEFNGEHLKLIAGGECYDVYLAKVERDAVSHKDSKHTFTFVEF